MGIVKRIVGMCEICAKFKGEFPRSEWHPLLYSENPGEVVYTDVIGPLPPGRREVIYIHCMINSATRMAKVLKIKIASTSKIIRILDTCMQDIHSAYP